MTWTDTALPYTPYVTYISDHRKYFKIPASWRAEFSGRKIHVGDGQKCYFSCSPVSLNFPSTPYTYSFIYKLAASLNKPHKEHVILVCYVITQFRKNLQYLSPVADRRTLNIVTNANIIYCFRHILGYFT